MGDALEGLLAFFPQRGESDRHQAAGDQHQHADNVVDGPPDAVREGEHDAEGDRVDGRGHRGPPRCPPGRDERADDQQPDQDDPRPQRSIENGDRGEVPERADNGRARILQPVRPPRSPVLGKDTDVMATNTFGSRSDLRVADATYSSYFKFTTDRVILRR